MLRPLIKLSLALLAAAGLNANAEARIGYTLSECRENYGHEVKTEPAWCGGTAYGFKSGGIYVYAIIGADDKVNDITYFDSTKVAPLSSLVQQSLWKRNQGNKVYDNFSPMLWNARKVFAKRLGRESGEHWVEYSWDGKEGLVMNASRNNGYQVRSVKAFNEEQKTIKSEMKSDVKVGEITQVR